MLMYQGLASRIPSIPLFGYFDVLELNIAIALKGSK